MKVKSIAKGEHSAIPSTFIKLPFAIQTFDLFIFECPLKTGFIVYFKTDIPLWLSSVCEWYDAVLTSFLF